MFEPLELLVTSLSESNSHVNSGLAVQTLNVTGSLHFTVHALTYCRFKSSIRGLAICHHYKTRSNSISYVWCHSIIWSSYIFVHKMASHILLGITLHWLHLRLPFSVSFRLTLHWLHLWLSARNAFIVLKIRNSIIHWMYPYMPKGGGQACVKWYLY